MNWWVKSKKKKVCITWSYIENFLISASTTTGCISISVLASLIGKPVGITSSAIGQKSAQ